MSFTYLKHQYTQALGILLCAVLVALFIVLTNSSFVEAYHGACPQGDTSCGVYLDQGEYYNCYNYNEDPIYGPYCSCDPGNNQVYACWRSFPRCADNFDNDGDGNVDELDPDCHTDGNPNNTASYSQSDDDESTPSGSAALGICSCYQRYSAYGGESCDQISPTKIDRYNVSEWSCDNPQFCDPTYPTWFLGTGWEGCTWTQTTGACVGTTGYWCESSANVCGQKNTGTIQCDGSCSASAPSNASCPAPSVSCSLTGPSSITMGQTTTWSASPSGGYGSYSYSWSDNAGLGHSGTASTFSPTFTNAGTFAASVTITDSATGNSVTQSCGSVTVTGASCSLPWGGTIAHGASVTAYQAASVVSPASCVSQTRTCTNGSLSGSYTNQSCTVVTPPTVTSVTISSPTVVPDASTQYTITVVGNNSGGGSGISGQYALVNYQGTNAGQYRGYLRWENNASNLACSGGGSAHKSVGAGFGDAYVNIVSCATSVSGNTRTVSFVITFNPAFTTPTTNNDISGYVENPSLASGWINFDINFGLALPTASFTATPSCTIASGASSCVTTINWTSSNVTQVALTLSNGSLLSTRPPGAQSDNVTIQYGGTTFQIRNNDQNGVVLATTNGTASCTAGTSWNGSVCATLTAPTVSCVGSPNPATPGANNVTWTATGAGGSGTYTTYTWSGSVTGTGNPKTGSHTAPGSYSASVMVTDSNGLSSAVTACSSAVTVALPDYQALAAPAISGAATVGSPVTFTGTARNAGAVNATSTSRVRFQIDVDSDGTGYGAGVVNRETAAGSVLALNAGTNSTLQTSPTWTPTVAGAHRARLCVDLPPDSYGSIGEGANEGNNCGADLTFTVTGALAATCSVSPSSGLENSTTFTWTATPSGGTPPYTYSWTGSAPLTSANSATRAVIYTTTGTKSASVTVTDSAGGNTGSIACIDSVDSNSTIDVNPSQPDLAPVASPNDVVTPTTATVGVATSFSMQVRNTGTASTGSAFTLVLKTADDASGNGVRFENTVSSGSALAAGGSTSGLSISYTPVAGDAGTRYFQICADQDLAGTGAITESNESNNCGVWTAVTIVAGSNVSSLPNLRTGAVTPVTANEDTPVAFSATISNTPTARDFTGGTNYVNVGTGIAPTTGITLCAWVLVDNWGTSGTSDQDTIIRSSSADTGNYVLQFNNSHRDSGAHRDLHFKVNNIGFVYSGTGSVINLDTWSHVCATYSNGGTGYIYANGVQRASGSMTNLDATSETVYLGSHTSGDGLDGALDDVRIYNRALSAGEISDIYNYATMPSTASGLMAHWRFDDATSTTAVDTSGNGRNGTITGGGTWVAGLPIAFAGTGSSFNALFQTAPNGSPTAGQITTAGSATVSAIASDDTGTAQISPPYPFPAGSAPTQWMRVCADKTSAGDTTGVIVESVEGDTNNCGPWTAITVSASAVPPSCSTFSVPATVALDSSPTVTWSCQNATSCDELSPADGFETSGATGAVTPATDTVTPTVAGPHAPYGMRCYGAGAPGGVDVYSNSFTVVAPSSTLTASPTRVTPGNPSTITGTCTGIPGGSALLQKVDGITNPIVASQVPVDSTGTVTLTHTENNINSAVTFKLYCLDSEDNDVVPPKEVTIRFNPTFEPF